MDWTRANLGADRLRKKLEGLVNEVIRNRKGAGC